MRPSEARWICDHLLRGDASSISPLANIGSSTLEFRTRKKPHIEFGLLRPLREAGVEVVNIDIRSDEGVDMVGDLTDPNFLGELKRRGFRSVICSNLLEHLSERGPITAALEDIVAPGGLVVVTVPRSYPYHADPIDTLYRPSPDDIALDFPGLEFQVGNVISDGTLRDEVFTKGFLFSIRYFILAFLRTFFILRPRVALAQAHSFLWFFRSFQVSCVVLRKSDGSSVKP